MGDTLKKMIDGQAMEFEPVRLDDLVKGTKYWIFDEPVQGSYLQYNFLKKGYDTSMEADFYSFRDNDSEEPVKPLSFYYPEFDEDEGRPYKRIS